MHFSDPRFCILPARFIFRVCTNSKFGYLAWQKASLHDALVKHLESEQRGVAIFNFTIRIKNSVKFLFSEWKLLIACEWKTQLDYKTMTIFQVDGQDTHPFLRCPCSDFLVTGARAWKVTVALRTSSAVLTGTATFFISVYLHLFSLAEIAS
jgi:hypothetical protein